MLKNRKFPADKITARVIKKMGDERTHKFLAVCDKVWKVDNILKESEMALMWQALRDDTIKVVITTGMKAVLIKEWNCLKDNRKKTRKEIESTLSGVQCGF